MRWQPSGAKIYSKIDPSMGLTLRVSGINPASLKYFHINTMLMADVGSGLN